MTGIIGFSVACGVFSRLSKFIKQPAALLATLLFALTMASGGDFTQTLTPEKIRAAGLTKLTPEELAQLETLVQEYKAGHPAAAPAAATTPPAVPGSNPAKKLPAWVGALLTLERIGGQPDKSDAMESRLKGDFNGWRGRTAFKLDNGQLWIQANSDSYEYSPTLKAPKVKIYPASLGTFWLEIEGVNQRCRVKPVKLE